MTVVALWHRSVGGRCCSPLITCAGWMVEKAVAEDVPRVDGWTEKQLETIQVSRFALRLPLLTRFGASASQPASQHKIRERRSFLLVLHVVPRRFNSFAA